jgi:hypothetical protein
MIKTKAINLLLKLFPSNEFRYTDIIKAVFTVKGKVYNHEDDRGYYSTNLRSDGHGIFGSWKAGYMRVGSKNDRRFLDKNENGSWSVQPLRILNLQKV